MRAVGERGADAHYVLLTSDKTPGKEVCTENYRQFADDVPVDGPLGSVSQEWFHLHRGLRNIRVHRAYFIDSCISGQPRRPHTRPATPAPPPHEQPQQGRPAGAP